MHVARDRVHPVARQLSVWVQLIVAQARLMRVPPQQAVHQRKAAGVCMQHQPLAVGHKAARHGGRRAQHGQALQAVGLALHRRLIGMRVKQIGHTAAAADNANDLRCRHHPVHLQGCHARLHQRTGR